MQKKSLFSSSVSQNSVDIDNPVPREGGLEKVSRQKNLPLTLRCAELQRDASQGQVPVTLSNCGGTGMNGGGFHLIAGVWKTSASKHSAAKRVQDCFVEWAGWDGHRSSLRGKKKNHHLALSFLRCCLFLCVLASKQSSYHHRAYPFLFD